MIDFKKVGKGFLAGALIGLIGEIMFAVLRACGCSSGNLIPVGMLVFGVLSAVLILTGIYGKIAAFGGDGAGMTVSGLMFGAVMASRGSKKSAGGAFLEGFLSVMKLVTAGVAISAIGALILGPAKVSIHLQSISVPMKMLYAVLISGFICGLGQLLTELKLSFPVAAVILIAAGGLLTRTGIIDYGNFLTDAGVTVTAAGCGNGAYGGGVALRSGSFLPFLITYGIDAYIVAFGALIGAFVKKK